MARRFNQVATSPSPAAGGTTELATNTSPVNVGSTAAPVVGQVLTATSATDADWAAPAGIAPSLFDANSILKADVDDTPVALAVADESWIGRSGGGNIASQAAVANSFLGRRGSNPLSAGGAVNPNGVVGRPGSNDLSDIVIGANSWLGRIGTADLTNQAVAVQQIKLRGSGDLAATTIVDSRFVGRPTGGNLGPVTASEALIMLRFNQQALTPAASITYDGFVGINATVTLNQAGHTLNITGALAGQRGTLVVKQDATGSRTITTYSVFGGGTVRFVGGTAPVLSTAANAVDILEWYYEGPDLYLVMLGAAFS